MILKEDLLEEKIFDASYHNEAIFDENLTNKDFQNCYFDHIDFQDISFEHSYFVDVTFSHCDLSNIKMNTTLFAMFNFKTVNSWEQILQNLFLIM